MGFISAIFSLSLHHRSRGKCAQSSIRVSTFQHRFHVHDFSAQKNVWLDSETLVRIPFFFGVSMLYAYLAQQAKSEKARADQAEQAQIVRRRLVSGLAHDIKSPLSVIKGFAEVIGLNVANVPGQEYSLSAAYPAKC
jgi:signal transduction histidine kinase